MTKRRGKPRGIRREWDEKLSRAASEEERSKLIEDRTGLRRERMEKSSQDRENKVERLTAAKLRGQNIVIDLDFSHLMASSKLNSLVHQHIMYCYAVNGRCESPAHLWLTGCEGNMESRLLRLPGFDNWIIDKDNRPYVEAFQQQKQHLVYLTADSETLLEELDPKKIYIVGGLVDRNRWKGITMKKAQDQGIQTAKLPIGNYLKMSSSQQQDAENEAMPSNVSGVRPLSEPGSGKSDSCSEGISRGESGYSSGIESGLVQKDSRLPRQLQLAKTEDVTSLGGGLLEGLCLLVLCHFLDDFLGGF